MHTRKFWGWLGGATTASALAIFAGCTQGSGEVLPASPQPGTPPGTSAKTTEARATLVDNNDIKRSEGVPEGVLTPSGLTVPRDFTVNLFAEGLTNPRRIAIAPGGTPQKFDVLVAESRKNRIRVLREGNGDGRADAKFTFTEEVSQPYGIAFTKGWVYIGNTDSIVRFPYEASTPEEPGQTATDQPPQQITRLTAGGYNQHWTRNLIFSPDGKKLYVTVGSSCNTCEESDPQRAAISVMNPDGSDRRLFASGLRNPVGLAWRNANELWTVVNERDWLGDDLSPDYLTHVQDGGFYGWPYAYTNLDRSVAPDPKFGERAPDKVKSTLPASVPVQAHSAALGLAFYVSGLPSKPTVNSQPRMSEEDIAKLRSVSRPNLNLFPADFHGDAFLAFHGSWNRSERTGYKIVRVDFQNNKPVSITDFVTGFLKDGNVSGRPVDVQVAPDGSLLFSDDDGGKIWRVSYSK